MKQLSFVLAAGALAAVGCTKKPIESASVPAASTVSPAANPVVAAAELKSAKGGSESGAVTIRAQGGADSSSLVVRLTVAGLTAGTHGFHIHERGDCSDPAGKSMGEHWNPDAKPHGPAAGEARHAGDLGNVAAGSNGAGEVEVPLQTSAASLIGRAVVVHEREDDLTSQPAGNAGNPVLCGVIAASSTPAAH